MTRASFQRKIELLEQWAADGVPPGQVWPAGPTSLARWHDDELCVYRWVSPNVASPKGRNADLRARFDAAVSAIAVAQGRTRGMAKLRAENAALKARNRQLSAQVVEMIERFMTLTNLLQQQSYLRRQQEAGRQAPNVTPLWGSAMGAESTKDRKR
ncbi:hypothetical protein [Arenibaculum pallidiluteum]|uniref:hypothetical protein n=1 Tax=Arenibaculum pallidiluteum TaxID=2812559 RepID=UPI001A97A4DA|nr:hypothetical protein [Arenibaculum pallidiluteum]